MLTDKQILDFVYAMRLCILKSHKILSKNLKEFDLTISQGQVIRVLKERGPLSFVELSRGLETTPSSMSGVIDRLEKAGLVTRERDNKDRRVVWVKLNQKSKEFTQEFPLVLAHYCRPYLEKLSSDDFTSLSSNIQKLAHILEKE